MIDPEAGTTPTEAPFQVPEEPEDVVVPETDAESEASDESLEDCVVPEESVATETPEAPETPVSLPPSTPNQHNLPSVATVDYEKLLMTSDDDDLYLEGESDNRGAEDTASNIAGSQAADNETATIGSISSVTSNFTAKFFPESLGSKSNDIEEGNTNLLDPPADGSTVEPGSTMEPEDVVVAPSTPDRSITDRSIPVGTPPPGTPSSRVPPTEYVVNDSPENYDDDISTLANETIIAKYMSGNTPQKPDPKVSKPRLGAPDVSSGASQLSDMPPPKKDIEQTDKTVEESPAKSSIVEETENKSSISKISTYMHFRGSGWTRRNYCLAFCLTFFLLAIIGGLGYTFHHLQSKDEEAPNQNKKGLKYDTIDDELPDSLSYRPTSIASSSPTGPTARPTRTPTSVPSRKPSQVPSIAPSTVPSIPPTLYPTNVPSVSPTWTPAGILRELLSDVTSGETLKAIEVRGTPQQKAFEWLHSDPNFLNYLKRRQTQRFALAVFYFSAAQTKVAQEPLQNWMSYDTNECTWFFSWFENRFPCGSDDIFKFFTLRNINLVGTIPSELAMLTKLESLVLRNNGLSGKIPNSFRKWSSLKSLDLRGNFLSGRIPRLEGAELTNLDLSWNALEGTIPRLKLNQLRTLDLTENFLIGRLPNELCSMNLKSIGVDCREVSCSCCNKCGTDETRFPVEVPPTPPTRQPTPFPTTPRPTPGPTKPPTPSPTPRPTRPPPTLPPTPPPTLSPVPYPTFAPVIACSDAIQVTKSCYSMGENIIVNFNNCNPLADSWVGIYADNVLIGQHSAPNLWKYACNSQSCSQAIGRGTVIMSGDSTGINTWPLPPGEYKAWIFQRLGSAPHPALSGTSKFLVKNGQC